MRVQRAWIAATFVTSLTLSAQSVSVQFGTVPRPEIERRLNLADQTNLKREQTLRALFEESGCKDANLIEQPVKHTKVPNVICTLPGETDSIVLVGGHFDFVNEGKGVVDNWSGSSLLPSLYLSLSRNARHHTFVFAGFTDEEKGLVGSRFYVSKLKKEQIRNISAMVNLDSVGTSPTKIELDRADKKLASALALIAKSFQLPLNVVNVHAVGRSDSDSFQDRRVPTLNVHSLTNETFPILHTRRDQLNAIHLDDYYDTYLLMRAYLSYLDQALDRPSAESEAKK
jgi:Zn-dependent M28 family amino/carboxypeptidase